MLLEAILRLHGLSLEANISYETEESTEYH